MFQTVFKKNFLILSNPNSTLGRSFGLMVVLEEQPLIEKHLSFMDRLI